MADHLKAIDRLRCWRKFLAHHAPNSVMISYAYNVGENFWAIMAYKFVYAFPYVTKASRLDVHFRTVILR
jgi:hypothetical protein